ncbi:MAG: aminotransferase class V-fold PLP-dependent enzyme, partial [Chlamydiota bacterium]
MSNKVYLDHHTATRPHPSSIEAMLPFYREHWGSIVSLHHMGRELTLPCEAATDSILELCGASGDHFHFFSSGAEAVAQVYLSHYFDVIRHTGKNHIVTSNVEEAPILMSLKRLEELDCSGKIVGVNAQGQITKEILSEALRPRTSLVSLSWANGLTGVIHPIADLAELCKEKGVMLHVDASYAMGKHYFLFEDLPIDYLTFEGSLLHAPKGTGGLLYKSKTPFSPPVSHMVGVPVGGVVALATALERSYLMFDH